MVDLFAAIAGTIILAIVIYMGEKKIKVNGEKIDKEINDTLGE